MSILQERIVRVDERRPQPSPYSQSGKAQGFLVLLHCYYFFSRSSPSAQEAKLRYLANPDEPETLVMNRSDEAGSLTTVAGYCRQGEVVQESQMRSARRGLGHGARS